MQWLKALGIAVAAFTVLAGTAGVSFAQKNTIRIIVPYTPGSGPDSSRA